MNNEHTTKNGFLRRGVFHGDNNDFDLTNSIKNHVISDIKIGDKFYMKRSYVGSHFRNSSFKRCTFDSCDFTSTGFSEVDFEGTSFLNCVFDSATFHKVSLLGSTMQHCYLNDASLREVNMDKATVTNCDATNSEWVDVSLDETSFPYSVFTNTILYDIDLSKVIRLPWIGNGKQIKGVPSIGLVYTKDFVQMDGLLHTIKEWSDNPCIEETYIDKDYVVSMLAVVNALPADQ